MNAMDALKYSGYMGQGLSSLYSSTASSAPGSDPSSLKSMYSSADSASHGTSLTNSGMTPQYT